MKRTITTTIITLSVLLGLALWSVGRGVHAKTAATPMVAATYPLNPSQFTSLGASPFTTDGTYSIDASKDNPAPTLSGPGIATPIAGVFYSPSGGAVANDEIAVFTFNSLNIPAGVLIGHEANANSRPVALLSKSNATIDGTIIVSGNNGANYGTVGIGGNGGNAGPGGGGGGGGASLHIAQPGSGGVGFVNGNAAFFLSNSFGGGGNGGSILAGGGGEGGLLVSSGGGGAFGGNGGNGSYSGSVVGGFGSPLSGFGGTAYGDLSQTLQGGSGGGGGGSLLAFFTNFGGAGGGGGGAVEIGAVNTITLAGNALANGGAGGRGVNGGGAGGAGGGIFLHAPTVSLTGNLNAIGGGGGLSIYSNAISAGGGGGGRVLILTADGTLASGSLDANVDINGGNSTHAGDGGTGVKQLGIGMFNHAPVAQCQPVTVAAGASCTANASINNGSYDPDSGDTITLTQSPAGPYPLGTTTVTLTVTDNHSVASSCQSTVTVVDQTAPDTNITSIPPSLSGANVSFSFTGSDNCSVSFECKLDSGAWTACASPQTYSSLANGAHTFQVRAKDAAGNVDPTPATYPWQVFVNTCGTTVNPASLAQPQIGLPYVQILSASPSGSYTFSLLTGTLPPGVQLKNVLGIYSLVGIPTTPGTYSFTLKAKKNNANCEGIRSYTVTIAPTVAPILNCVMKNANGTYTAKFGYDNTTGAAVTIPVGANNYFTPGAQNRGQVTTFQPGRVNNAFSVTFAANGSNLGIWFLKGPDGVTRPVNITTATLGCQ